ncbi:hypothetical protein C8J57DRAFT_1719386 [Mycena rebaudengoi]|nr:hypothetical protein C8J57DRAFT_1719386 [Mycena rebaudengoi]
MPTSSPDLEPELTQPMLAETRAQIADMDSHILALEKSLSTAHRRRQNLHTRLNGYKYPILSLPTEITSIIFGHFIPDYPTRPQLTGPVSPTILGQICRKWRDIALDSPRLWKSMQWQLGTTSTSNALLHLLQTWLGRSGDLPLSICLEYGSTEYPHAEPSLLPDFVRAILSHSKRWEYIRLALPEAVFALIGDSANDFPLLRHFDLQPPRTGLWTGPHTPFRNAPNLTSARLGGYSSTSVTLPWAQLTRIHVSGYDPLAVEDILRAATSLVEFKAIHIRSEDEIPDDLPPLMYLKTLSFIDDFSRPDRYRNAQELVLDALTAPALRSLAVSERQLGANAISTITSFLSRSQCRLKSLHVSHASLSKAKYCAAFPSVKSIHFRTSH